MKKWQSVSLLDAWLDFPFRFIPGKEFVTTHRFIYRQRRRCLYTNRNITYVKIIRITRVVDWVFKVFFEWIHFGGGDSNDINRDVEFLLNHINRSLREKVWKLDGAVLRDRPILFLTLFLFCKPMKTYSRRQWLVNYADEQHFQLFRNFRLSMIWNSDSEIFTRPGNLFQLGI